MSVQTNSDECAAWLKALGEPTRLKIVQLLLDEPRTVSVIAESLDIDIAMASHHLQVLLHSGLAHVVKEGRFSIYSINPEFLQRRSGNGHPTLDFGCCKFQLTQLE